MSFDQPWTTTSGLQLFFSQLFCFTCCPRNRVGVENNGSENDDEDVISAKSANSKVRTCTYLRQTCTIDDFNN